MSAERKILFADLDQTLLCDDKSVSEGNLEAIHRMLREGHYFAIATGRTVESGLRVARQLNLTEPNCYMVAYNGAVAYDIAEGRVMMKRTLPFDVVREIFDRAKAAGIYAQTYAGADVLAAAHSRELDYYSHRNHLDVVVSGNILDALHEEPAKVLLISLPDKQAVTEAGYIETGVAAALSGEKAGQLDAETEDELSCEKDGQLDIELAGTLSGGKGGKLGTIGSHDRASAGMPAGGVSGRRLLENFQRDNLDWERGRCSSFFSCDEYLEYCPPGVDKAYGMEWLTHELGLPMTATVAVGDEENDISMIKKAQVGVAVRNAMPAARAAADYVTGHDNNHDAVREVIERLVL